MTNIDELKSNDGGYSDALAIDIAILQQDIQLPEVSHDDELSYGTLKRYSEEGNGLGGDDYRLMEREYEDMIGNFYIPMLFPLVENGESTELQFEAPDTTNVLNQGALQGDQYVERNYVSLTIPKYILMNFVGTVPQGTKFLVGFVGGNASMSNIHIIGISGESLTPGGGEIQAVDEGGDF